MCSGLFFEPCITCFTPGDLPSQSKLLSYFWDN